MTDAIWNADGNKRRAPVQKGTVRCVALQGMQILAKHAESLPNDERDAVLRFIWAHVFIRETFTLGDVVDWAPKVRNDYPKEVSTALWNCNRKADDRGDVETLFPIAAEMDAETKKKFMRLWVHNAAVPGLHHYDDFMTLQREHWPGEEATAEAIWEQFVEYYGEAPELSTPTSNTPRVADWVAPVMALLEHLQNDKKENASRLSFFISLHDWAKQLRQQLDVFN